MSLSESRKPIEAASRDARSLTGAANAGSNVLGHDYLCSPRLHELSNTKMTAGLEGCSVRLVDTRLKRLEWMIETFGRGGDKARELAGRAGMSETAILTYASRLRKNEAADLKGESAKKICGACGVSVEWFLTGKGPRLVSSGAGEQYPLRAEAAAFARRRGRAEDAVDFVLRAHFRGADGFTVTDWLDKIEGAERLLRGGRHGDPVEGATEEDVEVANKIRDDKD